MFFKNRKQNKMRLVSLLKGTSFPSLNYVLEIFSATYTKILFAVCFLIVSASFLSCLSSYLYQLSHYAMWFHYLSYLFFPLYIFGNVMIWKFTILSIRNQKQSIEKQLKFFIQTNKLQPKLLMLMLKEIAKNMLVILQELVIWIRRILLLLPLLRMEIIFRIP